jgi:DNA-directed RNA polymerase I subunit RPA12
LRGLRSAGVLEGVHFKHVIRETSIRFVSARRRRIPVIIMSAIGSLIFCNDCGNLLDSSAGKKNVILTCAICGASCKDTSSKTVVTRSKPTAFPSTLRTKRSEVQTVNDDELERAVLIQLPCEECGHPEVRYYTQQLRGADEGSTVFYECENCGHKYVEIM